MSAQHDGCLMSVYAAARNNREAICHKRWITLFSKLVLARDLTALLFSLWIILLSLQAYLRISIKSWVSNFSKTSRHLVCVQKSLRRTGIYFFGGARVAAAKGQRDQRSLHVINSDRNMTDTPTRGKSSRESSQRADIMATRPCDIVSSLLLCVCWPTRNLVIVRTNTQKRHVFEWQKKMACTRSAVFLGNRDYYI